ncbi:DNA polymerase III subunit delta [Sinorhizobium sp. BG8]|uniref:DNA polymerase III subunit delta n=1 Tax=Sinorhizobium sp. BG8 TaxID=2613773 RepID=UPI00193C8DF7|nr:DNA polymerase III subunit delta [Sinorhizobium sp. BG8]QRM53629.1 DNA polymerase III subunit delta [Sinorhizobium sp. BG8]
MVDIKSHEFEGFLQKSAQTYRLFVVYGPDRGMVSERAGLLAKGTGVALDDPFSVIKLDVSDIASDPGRLMDEANALGLFGGKRLVWVRGTANEKPLVQAMEALADKPPPDCTIIVEAGDLKKGAGLRKLAETSRQVAAIPCYADDGRALNTLIDQELSAENLRLSPAARLRLVESLGGDRLASRNEIRKLVLYCRGMATIEEEDVLAAVGDASAISTDDAVDAILKGDKAAFIQSMQKIVASKTPIFLVLQGCLRTFQLLDLMRSEMDEKRLPAPQVVATLGRHLHFRRKPVIENALKIWSTSAIRREAQRLQAAILQSRQKATIEDTVAIHTLLATVLQSARK